MSKQTICRVLALSMIAVVACTSRGAARHNTDLSRLPADVAKPTPLESHELPYTEADIKAVNDGLKEYRR